MKQLTLLVCLGSLALAIASAAPGSGQWIKFSVPSVVDGTVLKPGDYRVEVNGSQAIIKGDKQRVGTSVRVEDTPAKSPYTSVQYNTANGNYRVEEIRLRGTKAKLVFGESGNTSTAAN